MDEEKEAFYPWEYTSTMNVNISCTQKSLTLKLFYISYMLYLTKPLIIKHNLGPPKTMMCL